MAQQKSGMSPRVSSRWLLGLARVLERTTRWVLQNVEPEASPARVVDQNLPGLAKLREAFGEVVAGEERALFEARVREIQDVGADEGFSRRLITLRFLDQLLEILQIARESGAEPVATARAYYQASELFDVPWLRRCTFAAAGDDQWEHRAAQVLSEDLSRAHRKLVLGVLTSGPAPEQPGPAEPGEGGSGSLFTRRLRARDVERFRGIIGEIKEDGSVGLAAISVAARELSALADRMARSHDAEDRR
jgi:glutamate dehydrogenase